ncbi:MULTISPECIES: hypothetical protein [Paraburkholderia]|jgi:protein involved in sex pheromone biosynthesis|uniref:Lipoprotein n=1 Tax=Paraburkholderia tropica TaxID=92647 RepID=A0ABX5MJ36_9BURK|nr:MULTISPECIES: hypothetical protein [Paraburkholderia]MBB2983062.1 protein involved in sex pheromone biosynthesis [Paraburkholderia tropica]MBB3003894.1 protein involved in sex pheromone biosynthesis [Paraburkholderia tropica]MBB6322738.1 protein involved in sex pheromone biosynthesis [Paraburkholderia tropica]MBN3811080.1 hypothetical protein [Paraburkholderia sp. Ac-20347]MDE1144166.1 hypothetical protein [Paraburkholderia tropica]
MKKDRLVAFALIAAALALAGCTSVAQKNTDQCVDKMQASAEPALVSVSDKRPSADGRSVTVSGMMEDRRSQSLVPAQVECQFQGKVLTGFRWLVPANFVSQH